mgnify:CR=1 FL=1
MHCAGIWANYCFSCASASVSAMESWSGQEVFFKAAADAAHALDGVLCLHAFHQAGNPLKVAVTAADDLNMLDGVVIIQLNMHFL